MFSSFPLCFICFLSSSLHRAYSTHILDGWISFPSCGENVPSKFQETRSGTKLYKEETDPQIYYKTFILILHLHFHSVNLVKVILTLFFNSYQRKLRNFPIKTGFRHI
jgi:hypothetical protein